MARRAVQAGYFPRCRGPQRATAVSRPRTAARYLAPERDNEFLLAIFSDAWSCGRRIRARRRPDDANAARPWVFRSRRLLVYRRRQGISRRYIDRSAAT